MMQTQDVIGLAMAHMAELASETFDVFELAKPSSPEATVNLVKIISKLSPLVGNLIEFGVCDFLNKQKCFNGIGQWRRQDPGFPDTIFVGGIQPTPGIEVKAWFPFATEITARFRDSQNHFVQDQTYVAILAWLPEHLVFGKPKIIDVIVVSGASVAKARDDHYHNPPDYLVIEPVDTTRRTKNLQQTNANGYKFQGDHAQFATALEIVNTWGDGAKEYSTSEQYQNRLRELMGIFPYRLDTNFAKIDRIVHSTIEDFKSRVYETIFYGQTIKQWNRMLAKSDDEALKEKLAEYLDIA